MKRHYLLSVVVIILLVAFFMGCGKKNTEYVGQTTNTPTVTEKAVITKKITNDETPAITQKADELHETGTPVNATPGVTPPKEKHEDEKNEPAPESLVSILTETTENSFMMNTGETGVYAESSLYVEHFLRFHSDATHEGRTGYVWLTFSCRIVTEDENAVSKGYRYQPFVGHMDVSETAEGDYNENVRFEHIKSGYYEGDDGKKRICDTFKCAVRMPENCPDMVFGLLDIDNVLTSETIEYNGENALVLFRLDENKAGKVHPSVYELISQSGQGSTEGKFVRFGSMEMDGNNENGYEMITWYVLEDSKDELLLFSRDVLYARQSDKPDEILLGENTMFLPSEDDILTNLWKNGYGYDTMIAAEPTVHCLEEMTEIWGRELPKDLYFTDYALSGEGSYAGKDGIGDESEGGSLLKLIGIRPCIRVKKPIVSITGNR